MRWRQRVIELRLVRIAWGGAEARALAEAYDAILAGLLRG